MPYRFTRAAEEQADAILLHSARNCGLEAAGRYGQLIITAATALGHDPNIIGTIEVPRLPGIRAYPLRLSKLRAEPPRRVGAPRHLVIYCVASDGVVDILGLVHDRMVLSRVARKAVLNADKR